MTLFFIMILGIGFLLEILSLHRPVDQLQYHCRPDGLCHEPDEEFRVETVIENHSKHSFRSLALSERFPSGVRTRGGTPEIALEGDPYVGVRAWIRIGGSRRLYRTRKIAMSRRGRFILPGATLSAGDFLGLKEISHSVQQWEEFVIYPKRKESEALEAALDGFYGDISVRRFLVEDPVLIAGFHDYTGTEPQRAISWTQSARRGQLMVKEFDYTQDLSATVILDVYYENLGRMDLDQLEVSYCLARTLCEYLEDHGVMYRFFHNAVCADFEGGKWQMPELGMHRDQMLEALGRAVYFSSESTEKLAERVRKACQERQAYYLIAQEPSGQTDRSIRLLEEEGAKVYVLYASDYPDNPQEEQEEKA